MEPNREALEKQLSKNFGFNAFYDDQWKTISAIMKGERVLLIEKTGFWKSLAFQFPATQFPGVTIIFSPLIALMRDQVSSLKSKGIPAWLINSEQSVEENIKTIELAKRWQLKILYIAPERQENEIWQSAVTEMNISFVVVDEAHCISSWWHDFRPAFRRIRELTRILPRWFPVLATTATATVEVAADIAKQIGGEITIIRWALSRPNLELQAVLVENQDDKFELISRFLRLAEWNGIIYTGTRPEAEILAKWCDSEKLNVAYYHGGLEADKRKQIEDDWKLNKYKAIISTNALGMGIDKSDIRFIVHTQVPPSPVHYYQEIGRAWRDWEPAEIVLLYNPSKDRELPEAFIEWARPSEQKYRNMINVLKNELLWEREICKIGNIKQNQWRTIKADLIDQGVIKEVSVWKSKKFQYQYGSREFDYSAFRELKARRLLELEKMIEYVYTDSCKMAYLCSYLWDAIVHKCGKCSACLRQQLRFTVTQETREKIERFKSDIHPTLETASDSVNMIDWIAGWYYGFSNIWGLVHESKYVTKRDFPDSLVKQTLAAYYSKFRRENFDVIMFVPPTKSWTLVENFSLKIGKHLWIPVLKIDKTREALEQKNFESSYWKKDNVANLFYTHHDLTGKKVLLIDDVYDSWWTIREIWKLLFQKWAKLSAPLVIAKTISGDSI